MSLHLIISKCITWLLQTSAPPIHAPSIPAPTIPAIQFGAEGEDDFRVRIPGESAAERTVRLRARRRKIEADARAEAVLRKATGKKPYWVRCNARGSPTGSRLYLWGAALRGYSHALDFSIVDLHDQPATAIEAIRRRLDESWEYVDYNLHDMAFERHLKQILKNKRYLIKSRLEGNKGKPRTCTQEHWENMKLLIKHPDKIAEAERLKVARGCQGTTSRSGHGEDFIREGLVSDVCLFFCFNVC